MKMTGEQYASLQCNRRKRRVLSMLPPKTIHKEHADSDDASEEEKHLPRPRRHRSAHGHHKVGEGEDADQACRGVRLKRQMLEESQSKAWNIHGKNHADQNHAEKRDIIRNACFPSVQSFQRNKPQKKRTTEVSRKLKCKKRTDPPAECAQRSSYKNSPHLGCEGKQNK